MNEDIDTIRSITPLEIGVLSVVILGIVGVITFLRPDPVVIPEIKEPIVAPEPVAPDPWDTACPIDMVCKG